MAAAQANRGLYDPRNEHDACGVGFVVNIKGRKSHDIIQRGLQILVNLDHRGAVGADPLMGDGAGCMIQMPDGLLRHWAAERGIELPAEGRYAVAMCFLPVGGKARAVAVQHFEHFVHSEGQTLLAWRDVGVDTTGLGVKVIDTMPFIAQAIVAASPDIPDQDAFERKILTIRKQVLNSISKLADHLEMPDLRELYIPSFSTRTVVYKGLLLAPQVESFYDDLRNPLTVSALALVHQRFSTNTFPSWRLAHPYRFICHNGEINTVRGNVNWMAARRQAMSSELLGADLAKMVPLIGPGQSDTACIDNALELLVIDGEEIKRKLAAGHPYDAWLKQTQYKLEELPDAPESAVPAVPNDPTARLDHQQAFGYTQEDIQFFLEPMARDADDPVGSMGTDTPIAALSNKPKLLFNYFKQNFAQVTNPPIDPIREELVMSLVSMIGPRPNLLGHEAGSHYRLEVSQPILTDGDLKKIHGIATLVSAFRTDTLDATWPASEGADGMTPALDRLCGEATEAVLAGHNILILSDRAISSERVPIPALLATSAVHHHLIRQGLRTSTGIVVETGEAREVHHFCVLAGYGAEAVNPYLAFDTLEQIRVQNGLKLTAYEVQKNYIKAV